MAGAAVEHEPNFDILRQVLRPVTTERLAETCGSALVQVNS